MKLAAEILGVMRGETRLLDGVSASFEPGQLTAICGPNGAGKSTLLAALAGLEASTSGAVRLDDADISTMHPRERAKALAYLPQTPEIAWDVPVRSLVALGRMAHGDAAAEPVDAVLQKLDLDELAERRVLTLSGGEKARVLLARALAGEPGWLLADEPLAALDLAHQHAVLGHLRAQADAGVGVVLVMHDLAMARNHADRVLVLNGGKLVADGAPEDALSQASIAKVWGVDVQWIGEGGAMALTAR